MVKQPCGVIYALVLTLLMIPPVALALMSGRVLAAEPQMPDLKPLFEFLDMLDRSWLGMALKSQGPKSWDGVWPSSRMVHGERWSRQHDHSDLYGASSPKFVENGLSPMRA
jgi:hypothetical protein